MANQEKKAKILFGLALFILVNVSFSQTSSRYLVTSTPYDPYMDTFRQVVDRGVGTGSPSLEQVQAWTKKAYNFQYDHTTAYRAKLPEELEGSGRGDCKDKALWLFARLTASGARNVELLIGMKDARAGEFHAWITLRHEGRVYLLDPTFSDSVREVAQYDSDEYIPAFSYAGAQTYAYQTAAYQTASQIGYDPCYQTAVPTVAGY